MKYKCTNCNDIIESKYRHHFVACTCFQESEENASFIAHKAAKNLGLEIGTEERYRVEHAVACAVQSVLGHGFFVDGGDTYTRIGGNTDDMEELYDDKED